MTLFRNPLADKPAWWENGRRWHPVVSSVRQMEGRPVMLCRLMDWDTGEWTDEYAWLDSSDAFRSEPEGCPTIDCDNPAEAFDDMTARLGRSQTK